MFQDATLSSVRSAAGFGRTNSVWRCVRSKSPTELVPVQSAGFDWREPHTVGDVFIDHAFTDFSAARVRLTDASGSGVEMTWGPECTWVQLHTADLPDPATSRRGLAVEPMTCPPDAFNSGTDLIRLEPGSASSAGWIISAI